MGNVTDVFISSRRTLSGKTFGFVRFWKVNDVDTMVANLRSMWFGSYHMFADVSGLPHKSHPHVSEGERKVQVKSKIVAPNRTPIVAVSDPTSSSRTYANIVSPDTTFKVETSQIDQPVRKIEINEDFLTQDDEVALSLMSKVYSILCIQNLYVLFQKDGFLDIDIKYLGGSWVSLRFSSKVSLDAFLANENVKVYFKVIQQLDPFFVLSERVVWLELLGLPLCAWNEDAFGSVVKHWGEFLFTEDDNIKGVASAKVCLLTSAASQILESSQVKIREKKFQVSIKEVGRWSPDFLASKLDHSVVTDSESIPDSEDSVPDSLDGPSPPTLEDQVNGDAFHVSSSNVPPELSNLQVQNSAEAVGSDSTAHVPPELSNLHVQRLDASVGSNSTASFNPSSGTSSSLPFPPGWNGQKFPPPGSISFQNGDSKEGPLVSAQVSDNLVDSVSKFIEVGKAFGLDMEWTEGDLLRILNGLRGSSGSS